MAIVYYVLANRQHAMKLTGDGPNGIPPMPPPEQRVELTALLLDDLGKTPLPNTPLYWWHSNEVGNGKFIFYSDDLKQSSWDTFQTTTDEHGLSSVWVGAKDDQLVGFICTILVSATQKPFVRATSTVGQQVVAIMTFDRNGKLATPTGIPVDDDGKVVLDPIDGSDEYPPMQKGMINTNPDKPLGQGKFVVWTCTGEDVAQLGELIGGIQYYAGGPVVSRIPYSAFKTKDNNLIYAVSYSQSFEYSQVWGPFDFESTPMARPDDVPVNLSSDLGVPKFVSKLDPVMVETQPPSELGMDSMDENQLNFAIPDYADRVDGDVIQVTYYLNGWKDNEFVLNSTAWPAAPYHGSDFEENYDGQNTMLPVYIPEGACKGHGAYGSMVTNLGYIWVQYTVNDKKISPWFYTRINFPGS